MRSTLDTLQLDVRILKLGADNPYVRAVRTGRSYGPDVLHQPLVWKGAIW